MPETKIHTGTTPAVITSSRSSKVDMNNGSQERVDKFKLTVADYMSFSMDPDPKVLKADYKVWAKDRSRIDSLGTLQMANDNVIFEVYRYEHTNELLFSPSGGNIVQRKIMPCIKILLSTSQQFAAGDIYLANPEVAVEETSREWLSWKKIMEVERPKPDLAEPARTVGQLVNWRAKDKFAIDPFATEDPNDEFTFIKSGLICKSLFKVKYTVK